MLGLFLGALIGFAVFIAGIGITGSILSLNPNNIIFEQKNSTGLIALKDKSDVGGSFFLGSGTIKSTQYYYYVSSQELGMHVDKVQASQSYIQYVNSEYRIETYYPEFVHGWMNWIGVPMNDAYYIIYIPDGSITTEFSIDLE